MQAFILSSTMQASLAVRCKRLYSKQYGASVWFYFVCPPSQRILWCYSSKVPAPGLVTLHKRESVVGVPIVNRASVMPTVAGPTTAGLVMPTIAGTTVADSIVPSVIGLPLYLLL